MRLTTAAVVVAMGVFGCGDDPASSGSGGSGASGASGGSGGGSGASGGSGGSECEIDTTYNPTIDPASFVAAVDNPLFPLVPGTKLVYEAGDETVTVEVLAETKKILGVTCAVVHDIASVGGNVIEDTFDWYAQNTDGAVWYMGEDTKELNMAGEVVSTEGSWEAGVDGAKPGLVIPATPKVGDKYRQEYYACEAEDFGEILALDASVTVPQGSYTNCLKTRDTTPLEPEVEEEKYYCAGVGLVVSVDVKSGEREELVSVTP